MGLRTLSIVLLFGAIGCTRAGAFGCSSVAADAPLAGGLAGTVGNDGKDALAQPMPILTEDEQRLFFKGRALFRDIWVEAPASTASRDGLGPFFNARSCEGCHVRDGRGRPPIAPGETATSMLVRLSIPGPPGAGASGGLPEPNYGGQLQPLGVSGVPREGDVVVTYEETPGAFADGTVFSLRTPTYEIKDLGYGPLHADVMVSPRLAPPMTGLGLLEAIPEAEILRRADPDDADGDGISGRPNQVVDVQTGKRVLGRFGWKANQPSVEQQAAGAFQGDLGLTSMLFPKEDCAPTQTLCLSAPSGGTPELGVKVLSNVVFYSRTLAVPNRRNLEARDVGEGEALFETIGCASCHTPEMTTGVYAPVPGLAYQLIHPYTDLLLHDMGEGLADGRPDHEATGREWRTPPLWGLGLLAQVNEGHAFLLHDGRARSVAEAILWHGGEAETARTSFMSMPATERDALLAFLDSL